MSSGNTKRTINDFCYYVNDKIGYGCSCEVFAGRNMKTEQKVAVKVIPKILGKKEQHIAMAECEIKYLKRLRGQPHILHLKHIIQTKSAVYIITQLCTKGSLHHLLQEQGRLAQSKAIEYLKQMISAFRSIVVHHIVHRDIKTTNFLVDDHDQIKLCDFGFAINVESCLKPLDQNIGSPLYMSPEALTYNHYGFQSDIWALGIVFVQMLLGKNPWKAKTQKKLIRQIHCSNLSQLLPSDLSQKSKEFIQKCLEKDRKKRMKIDQLLSYWLDQNEKGDKKSEQTHIEQQCNLTNSWNENRQNLSQTGDQRQKHDDSNWQSSLSHNSISQSLNKANSVFHSQTCIKNNQSTVKKYEETSELNKHRPKKLQIISLKTRFGIPNKFQKEKQEKNNCTFTVQSTRQITSHKQLSKKIEHKILIQVESQINYFRLMFRLFKKLHNYLKTKDGKFIELKEHLLYCIFQKINQIRDLKNIKEVSNNDIKLFKDGKQYHHIENVLNTYFERYELTRSEANIQSSYKNSNHFISLLTYAIMILYQNIVKVETSPQQLQQKKALIIIFEDLLRISQLFALNASGNLSHISHTMNLKKALEQKEKIVNEKYWIQLKQSFLEWQKQ